MRRERLLLAPALVLLGGCATLIHGPYQDVSLESNPPGATATVVPTLSERGQQDWENIQTIVQITAKSPASNHLYEISICCRHQPDIHFVRPTAP